MAKGLSLSKALKVAFQRTRKLEAAKASTTDAGRIEKELKREIEIPRKHLETDKRERSSKREN